MKILIFILVILLSGCVSNQSNISNKIHFPEIPYNGPQEAIIIGDSLSREIAATQRLNDLTSIVWENDGIGGNWTEHVLARRNQDVTIKNPKYILIIVGINDIYNNVPLETLKNNYLAFIDNIKKDNLKAIIANIPYGDKETKNQKGNTIIINNWLIQACADNNIMLIDFYLWSLANPELRAPDQVHFAVLDGYIQTANYIYSQLPTNYFEFENRYN